MTISRMSAGGTGASRPAQTIRGTTILAVRHGGRVVIAGDGQVSMGDVVMKHTARKVRRLYNDRVLAGFAGTAADAFALFAKFEGKLEEFSGSLPRAAVELAKEWRMDRALRPLQALLAAVDRDHALVISGTGDVIEPDDGIIGIGSGGGYATAAARALVRHSALDARQIAEESMRIAAGLCVHTNTHIAIEEL